MQKVIFRKFEIVPLLRHCAPPSHPHPFSKETSPQNMAEFVAETLCFTKSSASEKQGQNRVDGSDLKSKHAVTPDSGRRVFAPAQSCKGFGEGDVFL